MARIFALVLLLSWGAQAALVLADEPPAIQVIALFNNAAMVEFNGQQKLYRAGASISPDIKLVSADTRQAVFLIHGKTTELGLNARANYQDLASFKAYDSVVTEKTSVEISSNFTGMFETPGFINGRAVKFLVDTGATTVAMNEQTARMLGIQYREYGVKGRGSTAAGQVDTWHIQLNSVRVGGIELKNVVGTVIRGVGPESVLLGQSFLSQLIIQSNGQQLRLSKKH